MGPTDSDEPTQTAQSPAQLPRLIGDYRIVRLLGEGGMGIVYEAEQQSPKRPVALKVIRGGRLVDEGQVRLFRREAQTLARLRHPGIAAIYESGRTEEGQHFFAMELVRGETLSAWRRGRRVDVSSPEELRLRLLLFRRICEAVAYAHQRGVIHRDLKPGNVLVARDPAVPVAGSASDSLVAGVPEIKILDFGLARIADTDVAVSTIVTEVGRLAGTLAYMSPEQVRGNPDEIDLRSDVYSLGMILYELLTGVLPYDVGRTGMTEAMRAICEASPRPMGKHWPEGRRPPRDLETIVRKALEKEPGRRYQSVSTFSGDIERYLADQPILARPASTLCQLGKMARRHRVACSAAAAIVVLLAGVAVVLGVQARRIAMERDRANLAAQSARDATDFFLGLFKLVDPTETRGNNVTAREIMDKGAERIAQDLKMPPLLQARVMDAIGGVYRNLGLYLPAERLLARSLDIKRGALGEGDVEVAQGLKNLAGVFASTGRNAEAVPLLEQALAVETAALPVDDVRLGWTCYGLGANLRAFDTGKARAMFERALAIFERKLGPDDIAVAWCLNDLGGIRMDGRDFTGARPLLERALQIKEQALPPDHPDVAISLNGLGSALDGVGEYERAEALLHRALAIQEKTFGPDHQLIGYACLALGTTLRLRGDPTGALPYLERSVSIAQRVFRYPHTEHGDVLLALALALRDSGQYGRAETTFKEVLAIRQQVTPPGRNDLAEAQEEYATLLKTLGRTADADEMTRRAAAIRIANAAKQASGPP